VITGDVLGPVELEQVRKNITSVALTSAMCSSVPMST